MASSLDEEHINPTDLEGLYAENASLGSGSFGVVQRVSWRKTPCAGKIAHPSIDPVQKTLFLRELKLMAKIRHPNIVQFLGFVEEPFVIVMELVPNGDLRSYWRSHKLSCGHKTTICIEVLRAVAYLHNRKPSSIVHRDIKPSNVLITRSGVAKLTDFGLGRIYRGEGLDGSKHGPFCPSDIAVPSTEPEQQEKQVAPSPPESPSARRRKGRATHEGRLIDHATTVVGTEPYMAPEAASPHYTEKIDIYSAAVTFYELFEQANFDKGMPFAWAIAPVKVRSLIRIMGDADPAERPSALANIDAFTATGLARAPHVSKSCAIC